MQALEKWVEKPQVLSSKYSFQPFQLIYQIGHRSSSSEKKESSFILQDGTPLGRCSPRGSANSPSDCGLRLTDLLRACGEVSQERCLRSVSTPPQGPALLFFQTHPRSLPLFGLRRHRFFRSNLSAGGEKSSVGQEATVNDLVLT